MESRREPTVYRIDEKKKENLQGDVFYFIRKE